MAQREQKACEKTPREKQQEDPDYATYLFWYSRGRSSALYGPISLYSESEYDFSSSSRPTSPIIFAPMVNCTSPPPVEESVDVGVAPLDEPEAETQEPREEAPAKYSTLFKMGLFFSQVTHHLDRAIEGVRIKLRRST